MAVGSQLGPDKNEFQDEIPQAVPPKLKKINHINIFLIEYYQVKKNIQTFSTYYLLHTHTHTHTQCVFVNAMILLVFAATCTSLDACNVAINQQFLNDLIKP